MGSKTQGITELNATGDIPVIYGLITTNTMEQAEDRAGGKLGNKGSAVTAQIEELLEKTQRIDEKALDLSEQIIQIITQGQAAAWDHSSLYDVLGR